MSTVQNTPNSRPSEQTNLVTNMQDIPGLTCQDAQDIKDALRVAKKIVTLLVSGLIFFCALIITYENLCGREVTDDDFSLLMSLNAFFY